ncbi:hypothetical protein Sjap_017770 [Stephania japonica]|uniref:Uncharacterized protein n=1 Tax=Stephania japonica TaxID=461633 RepID=A0AAP0I6W7_9MAGN
MGHTLIDQIRKKKGRVMNFFLYMSTLLILSFKARIDMHADRSSTSIRLSSIWSTGMALNEDRRSHKSYFTCTTEQAPSSRTGLRPA